MLRRLGPVLLVLALVSACSGEPEVPAATLPPVTSAPSPSPSAVVVPELAKAETAEGAGAFAELYFETLNEAYRTRDATGLRQLSHPDCPPCNVFIEQVEDLAASNQTVESGDYILTSSVAPPPQSGEAFVDLIFDRADTRVLDAEGAVVDSGEPIKVQLAQLRLVRGDDGWLVRGYRLVEL